MKIVKFILIIALMVYGGLSCDSSSSTASKLGGPDITPEDIVDAAKAAVGNPADVLVAVQEQLENNLGNLLGNEDAQDIAAEVPGEDILDNLGIVAAQEAAAPQTDEDVVEATPEPVVEQPAAEQPAAEQPAAEQPAAEQPAAEQPAAEQPAAEQPAQQPAAEQPAVEQPAVVTVVQEPVLAEITAELQEAVEQETGKAEPQVEKVKEMTVTLDSSAGRWFAVEEKLLDSAASGDHAKNKDLIKQYRGKIDDLEKSLKEAEKIVVEEVKNTGKGKDNQAEVNKQKADKEKKIAGIAKEVETYLELIKEAREKIGYGKMQKGIYTYWANENLKLKVANVTEAGWYSLRIVAKNYGKLPNWYKSFNITVMDDTDDEEVGGLSIDASDNVYKKGSMLVYLDEGDTEFNLLWTNDAYAENKYDANIQIKSVTLKYSKKEAQGKKSLVRNAHQYSTVDGRFFWDKKSLWTFWGDQTIGFNFPELAPGKYEVRIWARNYGTLPLPEGYDNFNVIVDADGTSGEATISANTKKYRKGSAVLDITGPTEVLLTWMNDSYTEGQYDANIQIKKIMLKRLGNSERSALAAYLLGSASGNRVLMTGILVVLLGLIAGISLWNRRRAKEMA